MGISPAHNLVGAGLSSMFEAQSPARECVTVTPLGQAIIQLCQYHAGRVNLKTPHTVCEVQPDSAPEEIDGGAMGNGRGYDDLFVLNHQGVY